MLTYLNQFEEIEDYHATFFVQTQKKEVCWIVAPCQQLSVFEFQVACEGGRLAVDLGVWDAEDDLNGKNEK